jgi:hypothetical protein
MFHHSEEMVLLVQQVVRIGILRMHHPLRDLHQLLGLEIIPRLLQIDGLVQCLNLQLVLSGHRIDSDHLLEINQNKTQLLQNQNRLLNNLPPGDALMLPTIQKHPILQIVCTPQVEESETHLSPQVYMEATKPLARQQIELEESQLLWDPLLRIAEATLEVALLCKTHLDWELPGSRV